MKNLSLLFGDIECIITEVTFSKKKWLLIGTYNPNKSIIASHIKILIKHLSHYLSSYDNIAIIRDFNSDINEDTMSDFCSVFNLSSLIKDATCFKNPINPSCIDLILTNRPSCFQNSVTVETGISDFHKLTVSVLKTNFGKTLQRSPSIGITKNSQIQVSEMN